MSLKTHPIEKHKCVNFDEYKLLDSKIDKLAEITDKMNTRPQGRQIQQNKPYKPYIHEAEVMEIP